VTFVLDCGKGAAVAWAAGHFGLSAAETAAAIIAAVCGHIWPVQLGFRGGKGIATSLGALAVYDPRIVLVMASVFLVCFVVLRVFVVSGLVAFVLAPLLLIRSGLPGDHLLTAAAVAGIVLIPHRDVVRDALAVRRVAPTHRR